MTDAQLLGVVLGDKDSPRIGYVNARLRADETLLASIGSLPPTQVLRFAAICEAQRCVHYDGSACQLAARIVAALEPVVDALPPCTIRPTCRWHAQEGREACLRCPQVVTSPSAGGPLEAVAGVAGSGGTA